MHMRIFTFVTPHSNNASILQASIAIREQEKTNDVALLVPPTPTLFGSAVVLVGSVVSVGSVESVGTVTNTFQTILSYSN